MKLLCLNVGLFLKNNQLLNKYIRREDADILCLQEVTRGLEERTDKEFITYESIIEASVDLGNNYFSPMWNIDHFRKEGFHKEDDFYIDFNGRLDFGYLTRSRFNIESAKNVF